MKSKAKVIKFPDRSEKVPATHAFCEHCGKIRAIEITPVFQEATAICYDAVHVTCARCKLLIAELYRQKGIFEP